MSMPCEDQWRRRAAASPFSASVSFTPDALVLGQGTILRRLGGVVSKAVSLRADGARDRMVALLAVAGHGRLAKHALLQLEAALDEWWRGDRGLAAIRLAFAPLPRHSGAAVTAEKRGRQIYYRMGDQATAAEATRLYGKSYATSHFLVCH